MSEHQKVDGQFIAYSALNSIQQEIHTHRRIYEQQQKMITTLYTTLHNRVHCPDCGGRGTQWVIDEDGNVDVESCRCEMEAREVLERYGELREVDEG